MTIFEATLLKRTISIFACSVIFCLSIGNAKAETLNVAVASNFYSTLKRIAKAFEAKTGHRIRIVSGSSGKIVAQITHGAPFDIFMSADQQKVDALAKNGLLLIGSQRTYAIGKLSLWSNDSETPLSADSLLSLSKEQKLAIANPAVAPYGVAAKEVLQKLELFQTIEKQIIIGENIGQAFQFVATKNAKFGLVAYPQVLDYSKKMKSAADLKVWVVPTALYSPITQDCAIVSSSHKQALAQTFLDFVTSDFARKLIQDAGYILPRLKDRQGGKNDAE